MSRFIYCYVECHYAEWLNAESNYSECFNAERHFSECLNVEHNYAESLNDEHHSPECHVLFIVMLKVTMLSVLILNVISHYAECHYTEYLDAECRYAECRYGECRGAFHNYFCCKSNRALNLIYYATFKKSIVSQRFSHPSLVFASLGAYPCGALYPEIRSHSCSQILGWG